MLKWWPIRWLGPRGDRGTSVSWAVNADDARAKFCGDHPNLTALDEETWRRTNDEIHTAISRAEIIADLGGRR